MANDAAHQVYLLQHYVAEIDRNLSEHAEADEVLRALVRDADARSDFRDGAYRLRLLSVVATCTAGSHGLLRKWQKAAHRKIAVIEGRPIVEPNFYRPLPKGAEERRDPINLQGSGPAPIVPR